MAGGSAAEQPGVVMHRYLRSEKVKQGQWGLGVSCAPARLDLCDHEAEVVRDRGDANLAVNARELLG